MFLDALGSMADAFFAMFDVGKFSEQATFAKIFNTAAVRQSLDGTFEPTPLRALDVERFLSGGFRMPEVEVASAVRPFADRWLKALREELEPLVGKKIEPRLLTTVLELR